MRRSKLCSPGSEVVPCEPISFGFTRNRTIITDVGDVVGILVPNGSGRCPRAGLVSDDHDAAPTIETIVVACHNDFRRTVVVYVRDERVFHEGSGGVPFLGHLHVTCCTIVDPESVLIGVDHLGRTVSFEVEDGAPRFGALMVGGAIRPEQ